VTKNVRAFFFLSLIEDCIYDVEYMGEIGGFGSLEREEVWLSLGVAPRLGAFERLESRSSSILVQNNQTGCLVVLCTFDSFAKQNKSRETRPRNFR